MTERWTGSNGRDIKTATKSGWGLWWESWEMHGLGGDDVLTGGAEGDKIYGGEGQDDLSGLDGNDYIDGGTGSDTMYGGRGDDTFVVDSSSDLIIERAGEGSDRVDSYAYSYTLPNHIETVRLMDDSKGVGRNVVGNSAANHMTGNAWGNIIRGMGGDDTIIGNGGIDELDGGEGNDLLISTGGDKAFGGSGNDMLYGGAGDRLYGGTNNDTYFVLNNSPIIVEYANEGFDTIEVFSSEAFRMSEDLLNVEKVVLRGAAKYVDGNSSANQLEANQSYGSILNGMGGDDGLIGMGGADALNGGEGADIIVGNGGNDFLSGYGGSGSGRDYMSGGVGADTFSVGNFYLDAGHVVISDFSHSQGDKVQIKGQASDFALQVTSMGGRSDVYDGALYHKASNDLIAVFYDNTSLALGTDFQYVS